MMKKALATAVLAIAPFGVALADNDIGCGLGTQIWAGQSGLVPKVLGATTNGTFGNQTFGITSGTLGCSSDGVVTVDARTSLFAAANIDQLAAEIAAGQGETLDTLAALYEVEAGDRAAFASMAQREYGNLFSSDEVTVADVLAKLETAMSRDAALARYV